uniref:Secreted protein n=1 Tax=Oryzias latipes TaxID=8090 RepID=A0A3B3H8T4_ORYLA
MLLLLQLFVCLFLCCCSGFLRCDCSRPSRPQKSHLSGKRGHSSSSYLLVKSQKNPGSASNTSARKTAVDSYHVSTKRGRAWSSQHQSLRPNRHGSQGLPHTGTAQQSEGICPLGNPRLATQTRARGTTTRAPQPEPGSLFLSDPL